MPSRRAALRTLGTALGVGLAGCTATDSPDDPATATPDGPSDGTSTQTPTPGTPSTPTDSTTPTDWPTPATPEDVRWAVTVEGGVGHLAFHDGRLLVGATDGTVRALDPADGTELWRFDAPNPVRSYAFGGEGLLVADGTLYAVSSAFDGLHGQENAVHALDPATGTEQWTYAPDIGYASFGLQGVTDRTLLVGTNDDALSDSGDPTLAVDTGTGTLQWQAETGDVSGAVLGDASAFVAAQTSLYALGLADGRARWTATADDAPPFEPALTGDNVYFGYPGGPLRALAPETGRERWRHAGPVQSLAVGDDPYVGGEQVRRLAPDGSVQWAADAPSIVRLVGDRLLATGESAVASLDPADGTEQWRASPDATYPRPVALSEGTVVLEAGRSPRLLGLDAATGETRWTLAVDIPESYLTGPVAGDGAVYAATPPERGDDAPGRLFARDLTG